MDAFLVLNVGVVILMQLVVHGDGLFLMLGKVIFLKFRVSEMMADIVKIVITMVWNLDQ